MKSKTLFSLYVLDIKSIHYCESSTPLPKRQSESVLPGIQGVTEFGVCSNNDLALMTPEILEEVNPFFSKKIDSLSHNNLWLEKKIN